VLKALKTSFVSLGNHEFDIPTAEFARRIEESDFQWLCTNSRFADDAIEADPRTQPATLVELAPKTHLVIFGLLYPGVFKGFGMAVEPAQEARAMIGRFEAPPGAGSSRLESLGHYAVR